MPPPSSPFAVGAMTSQVDFGRPRIRVEVVGGEEVALVAPPSPHRLLVDSGESPPLLLRGLRPRDDLAPAYPRAQVAPDLLAVAHPALARQLRVGDLDRVALPGAGERRLGAEARGG